MAEEAAPTALMWAYRQWRFAEQLLGRMKQRVSNIGANQSMAQHSLRKRVEKGFGRWLQTMQHYSREQLHERFPLFPRQPFEDERSRDELERMLRQDMEMSPDQASELANELLSMIQEFLARNEVLDAADDIQVRFEEDHEHPENGGRIVVAQFHTQRCPRVSSLVHHYGELNTALVCLRYEPLRYYTGGESGMTVRSLNILHDIGGATHEGFASPLNCRLLGRPDTEFCSLFADTDAAFGSLGNFFGINLSDHPGGWILNPPFVEPVMKATANRVQDLLQEAEPGSFWFYITFPMWEDNSGWRLLDGSEFKVARIDFDGGTFLQQDAYGAIYRPQVPVCIFVLGQLPENVDLMRLRAGLCENASRATIMADWLEACDIVV